MKSKLYISILILFLSACSALEFSSGVLPLGNGSYTISTEYITAARAKQMAYESAIEFCKKSGKEIKVISSEEVPNNKHNLEFTCR